MLSLILENADYRASSMIVRNKDRYGRINSGLFILYIMKREPYASQANDTHGMLEKMYEMMMIISNEGVKNIEDGVDEVKEGVKNIEDGVDEVKEGVKNIKDGIDEVKEGQMKTIEGIKNLATGVNWALGALSSLTANEFKECPKLVVMSPSSVAKKDLKNPKNWLKAVGKQRSKSLSSVATPLKQATNPLRS